MFHHIFMAIEIRQNRHGNNMKQNKMSLFTLFAIIVMLFPACILMKITMYIHLNMLECTPLLVQTPD